MMVNRDEFDLDGWLDLCKGVYTALWADDPDKALEILEYAGFGRDDLERS